MLRTRSWFAPIVLFLAVSISAISYAQDSLSDPVVPAQAVMGEPSAKNLAEFRKAVIAQAELKFKAKEITRLQLMGLRIATTRRASLEQMHQVCAEQAIEEGAVGSYGALDWVKLTAFIKEMLPYLLEFIKLFADNGTPLSRFIAYVQPFDMPVAIGYGWADDLRLAS